MTYVAVVSSLLCSPDGHSILGAVLSSPMVFMDSGVLCLGRLGLCSEESHCVPQTVQLSSQFISPAVSVVCGVDCTMLLCQDGSLLGCGSNRSDQ